MKIAVVGPSPIPYTIGGAENLMWGLCDAINQYTTHQAELIKVPVKELSFWDLIDSYYKFYQMDLSHFDMIITSKYPSWMVKHDNSICYMMHTLRGLYDTYHFMGQPWEVKRGCKPVDELLDYMEKNVSYDALDTFFDMLFALRNNKHIPGHYFGFPAPFIRAIVHYMDQCALQQDGVRKMCAISDTVKYRKEYFPEGAKVQTIYPPTTLKDCTCGDYKYIFMISRLDGPKRIDLLIRAMNYVKSDVKLLIAGTGPEKEKLEKLAKNDKRIEFLGFVKDEEVEEYYANSLVIPYFPYDEDYGYITIEAMLHKKPVITTVDAGGPTEFVKDGETGFVVPLEEERIAEKIDYMVQNPQEAKRMGEAGYQIVKAITWENVVERLLQLDEKKSKERIEKMSEKRRKVVVTSTFSVYPPQGGGQARTFQLYKNLADTFDVEIVAFDAADKSFVSSEIAKGLRETKIPKSEEHQNEEVKLEAKVRIPVTDIAMITMSGLTPKYGKELERAIGEAETVVVSHPYLYSEVAKYIGDKRLVYEAQDVEYKIKKEMLPANATTEKLLQQIYDMEKECCEKSEFIMTCSEEDKESLCELYDVAAEKVIVVPNGVDCSATKFTAVEDRLGKKRTMGLANEKIGLFMGSWHQPNLEACEKIFEIAKKCKDVKFILMGSQCLYFQNKKIPSNVGLLGLVSEEEKNRVFSVVDFALNPMLSGSGTNLKMFDYMSAGIPVITTEFGTRGIDDKEVFDIASVEEMPNVINNFDLATYDEKTKQAREVVEQVFDWKNIVSDMAKKFS